jgi:glycine/D-amino acid oxidase-like deaminating enzyme
MTTGLELGSSRREPDARTPEAMAFGVGKFFADERTSYRDPWVGFRPLTPDGLPIVGRLAGCPRVIVSSGYGTLGMTLAPALARIVRQIISGGRAPDIGSPKRFQA